MTHTVDGDTSAPPTSIRGQSFTLDLPRESRKSLILRRDASKDGAGAGYELEEGILQIHLEGVGQLGTVLRLNATSIWFEPRPGQTVPYGQRGRVTLVTDDVTYGAYNAKFAIEALEDDVHAVARLQDISLAEGQKLVAFMLDAAEREIASPVRPLAAVQTDITDPVRLRVVLQSLVHRSAMAVIKCQNMIFQASLTGFDAEEGTLFWQLLNHRVPVPSDTDISIEVAGYNCVYQMHFDKVTVLAYGVSTTIPDRIDYSRYRRYRRAPISDKTVVRLEHPLWSEIPTLDRPLLDVSFGGIAFPADPLKDALYIGLRIENIEIVRGGEAPIRLRGTVRSLLPTPEGTITCGLSVEPKAPQFAEAWATFVMQALNQTTAPIGDRVEQLWKLYTDSGYFNLSGKDPKEFESLAASFRMIIERTGTFPWVSYQSVWPSGSRIDASVSVIKIYRGTWMFHQVAKRRAQPGEARSRHVLRDTYLRAFEYMQSDSKCNWVLMYGEARVRWMQKSHYAFAEHFEETGAAMARSFRLMEADCHLRADPLPGAYRVGAAGPEETQLILEVLEQTLPKPYLESCDLVASRFDIAATKAQWSEIGLERDREVWVARQRSMPIAAAILETGETGTNLFRLMDSVRLVALFPDGEQAFPNLLEKAKAWFLGRGKSSFVYFCEHPDKAHIEATRLRDLGEGRIWALRNDLIPDFLEVVCELTSDNAQPLPGRSDSATTGPVSVRGEFMLPGMRGVDTSNPGGPISVRGGPVSVRGARPSRPDRIEPVGAEAAAVPGPLSVRSGPASAPERIDVDVGDGPPLSLRGAQLFPPPVTPRQPAELDFDDAPPLSVRGAHLPLPGRAESPGAESPGAESPGAEPPLAESPGAQSPGAESPGAEAPRAEDPGAEAAAVPGPVSVRE